MSSFSRGLSLHRNLMHTFPARHSCNSSLPRFIFCSQILRSVRFFQTATRRLYASKPTTPTQQAKPPPNPTVHARSYAEQLALKPTPTMLYEAPSHFFLRFFALSTGVFCASYAIINYWQIHLHPPPDLSWWAPHAYGVICTFMIFCGGYFTMRPSGIIRAIRALPAAQAERLAGRVAAGKGALVLEIELGRAAPMMPARKLYVAPSEVMLPFRMQDLHQVISKPSVVASARQRMAEAEEARKKREYEMSHIMTAPFRHFGRAMAGAAKGAKMALTGDGFTKVKVKDRFYRLDVTGGWILDGGKPLDRLVSLQPRVSGI